MRVASVTPVVAIVGQTATGKSDVAVQVARRLGAEIVNADASQLYRGMDIGTAKTPLQHRCGVAHHQLDVLEVTQTASVAAYQRGARADIEAILSRGRVPILVGGSGLYVQAVLDPLRFPGTDPRVRARIAARADEVGAAALHAELAQRDPRAAASILPTNVRRVVRALEVIELTGGPFTATLPRAEYVRPTVAVGLRRPAQQLQTAIADRVHRMMEDGFLAEVRDLEKAGLREGPTASKALGYSQLLAHLAGDISLDDAVAQTISATTAFAKRQAKWFRRDKRISWIDVVCVQQVVAEVQAHLHKAGLGTG
ncbi:MAG: tRNA (adenosine(37)-N6)-dimethylallyltransferase MiaA [Micrococcales bacterium]|nr:MAG: tRNA (adenosine(37)-N6)-dimethylallyltransferase MiaA [Micrococcales bacterium]